jgi:hypothetical protein
MPSRQLSGEPVLVGCGVGTWSGFDVWAGDEVGDDVGAGADVAVALGEAEGDADADAAGDDADGVGVWLAAVDGATAAPCAGVEFCVAVAASR